MTAECREI